MVHVLSKFALAGLVVLAANACRDEPPTASNPASSVEMQASIKGSPADRLQEPQQAGQVVFANATEILSGSGIMTITGVTLLDSKVSGPNRFFTRSVNGTFTGTLAGTFTSVITVTQRDNGIETLHGTRVFTGTVAGRSGTCEIEVTAAGAVGAPVGHFTITTCTGGLEGLHGHGTFQSIGFGISAYTVQFNFSN